MIEGLVFDLDGTLLDTLEGHAQSFNRALTCMDMPAHEVDAYRYFIGDGAKTCAVRALPASHSHLADQCVAYFIKDYAETWHETTFPFPGIDKLLKTLAHQDIPLAVLSNKDHMFTQQMILQCFPGIHFACVAGYGFKDEVKHKPDKSGPLLIAETLKANLNRLVMIGDTATDMATAIASGMMPVGVLWGFRGKQELVDAGALHLIASPDELLKLL
jgi:phosphoglycolate phosphatase